MRMQTKHRERFRYNKYQQCINWQRKYVNQNQAGDRALSSPNTHTHTMMSLWFLAQAEASPYPTERTKQKARNSKSKLTSFPPKTWTSKTVLILSFYNTRSGWVSVTSGFFNPRSSPWFSAITSLYSPLFTWDIEVPIQVLLSPTIILYLFIFFIQRLLFMCIHAHPHSHTVGKLFSPLSESSTTSTPTNCTSFGMYQVVKWWRFRFSP